ncbi:hypothetical protein FRC03_010037 [Tulasnella sp. 419]|nr:hypothetical protein FRC03_010037 [Tulasnella sp. 419]
MIMMVQGNIASRQQIPSKVEATAFEIQATLIGAILISAAYVLSRLSEMWSSVTPTSLHGRSEIDSSVPMRSTGIAGNHEPTPPSQLEVHEDSPCHDNSVTKDITSALFTPLPPSPSISHSQLELNEEKETSISSDGDRSACRDENGGSLNEEVEDINKLSLSDCMSRLSQVFVRKTLEHEIQILVDRKVSAYQKQLETMAIRGDHLLQRVNRQLNSHDAQEMKGDGGK